MQPRAVLLRTHHPGRLRRVLLGVIIITLVISGGVALYIRTGPPIFLVIPGQDVIIYTSEQGPGSQLYAMYPDGSRQTRLTYLVAQPKSWWPAFLNPYLKLVINKRPQPAGDGQGIVFVSDVDGPYDFYQVKLDGSGVIPLPSPLRDHNSAKFSPDGQQIAFINDQGAVALINTDGSGERCLTCGDPAGASSPVWSPNNRRLIFERGSRQGVDLYVIDTDGTNVRRLTNTAGSFNVQAAWSPDGQRIAFRSDRDGAGTDIYVTQIDGSGVSRLTTTGREHQPAWSPDGKRLAFASTHDGGRMQIYVMNADGSNQQRLTSDLDGAYEPVWMRVKGDRK